MNALLALFQQILGWVKMGDIGKNAHTFGDLLQEVATAIYSEGNIEWIGCPAVPEQVLGTIKIDMLTI